MRSDDLHPGHNYMLSGNRERIVTILDTPPEVRRRARVRVRYLNGIAVGSEVDMPTRRIVSALTGPAVGVARTFSPIRAIPRTLPLERSPEVGERVIWRKTTGELEWTVESVDVDFALAVLTTIIMERTTTMTAPIDELEIVRESQGTIGRLPEEAAESGNELSRSASPEPYGSSPVDAAAQLAPEKPRRELDELLDDVLLLPTCVDQYRRRYARSLDRAAATRALREEIRVRGYVAKDQGQHPYARIRVEGRFEIVLPHRPTPDSPVRVRDLTLPSGRRGKRPRPRGIR